MAAAWRRTALAWRSVARSLMTPAIIVYLFTQRWVEFYQVMKLIRAKQAPLEGGVA